MRGTCFPYRSAAVNASLSSPSIISLSGLIIIVLNLSWPSEVVYTKN